MDTTSSEKPTGNSDAEMKPKESGKDDSAEKKEGSAGRKSATELELEPKQNGRDEPSDAKQEQGSAGGKDGHEKPRAAEMELKAIDETKLTAVDNEEGSPGGQSVAKVELKAIDKDGPSDAKHEQEFAGGEDGHEELHVAEMELKTIDKEQESGNGEDGHENTRVTKPEPKMSDETKLTAADNEEGSTDETKAISREQESSAEENGHDDPRAAGLEPKSINETKLTDANNGGGSVEVEPKAIDKGQGSSGGEDGHEDLPAAKLKPKTIDEGRPTEKERREEQTEGGGSKRSASLDDCKLSKILPGVASIDLGRDDDEVAGPIDKHRGGSYDAASEGHEGKGGKPPDGDSCDSSQQPPQRSKKSDKFTSVDHNVLGFTSTQRPQYQPLGRQVFTNRGGQDGRGGGSTSRFPVRPYGGNRPTEDQRMRNVSNRSPSFQQRRPMTPGAFSSGGGGGSGPYPRQGFENRVSRGGGQPNRFMNRPAFDCPNQRLPQNVYNSQRDQGGAQQDAYTNQRGPGGGPPMSYHDQGGPGGGPPMSYRDQGGLGGGPPMSYHDQRAPQTGYKQGYNAPYQQQGVRSAGGSFQSQIAGRRHCITSQNQTSRPAFDASSRGPPPPHIPTMPAFASFMIQPPGGGQAMPYFMVPATQMPYGMPAPFYPNMMPMPCGGVMPMGGSGQPQPGTKCEVLASDQNYYPATIIQPRSEDPNTLTVRFDSTGYETNVNMQALRFNSSGEN